MSGALFTRPRYWNLNPICGSTEKSKPAPYVNSPRVSFLEVVHAVPQIVCLAVAPRGLVISAPPPANANGRTFSTCRETSHSAVISCAFAGTEAVMLLQFTVQLPGVV